MRRLLSGATMAPESKSNGCDKGQGQGQRIVGQCGGEWYAHNWFQMGKGIRSGAEIEVEAE